MPITPSCQSSPPDDVAAAALPGSGQDSTCGDRVAHDAVLDGLAVAVQRLELAREPLRLRRVVGEQQLERRVGMAEPAGGVDARREAEAERACLDRGGVDARGAHERAQARARCVRASARRPARERAVLVDERHDVGDGRERDEVELRSRSDAPSA